MEENNKPIGICTLTNTLSILVYDINYGIDDEIVWAYSTEPDNKQTSTLIYTYEDDEGNPLDEPNVSFMADERRIDLDEVMRTDLTESVEKLEEVEAKLDQNVKEWLLQEYPEEEEFLVDMRDDLTFQDVYDLMMEGNEIYDILNISDSTDREYVFNGLSEATGKDYEYFYQLWIHGPYDPKFLKQAIKENNGEISDDIIELAIKGYLENSNGIFTDDSAFTLADSLVGTDDIGHTDEKMAKRIKDVLHKKFKPMEENLTEAEEKELYVYSNADTDNLKDAKLNVSLYKQEAPELNFKIHKDGDIYFVDFIGSKEDIENYLKRLGWYNDEELASEEFPLIKKYN